jgi:hypothetical protein
MSAASPLRITGQVNGRGPRVMMTLFDQIDGHALARIEIKPDKAAVLQAAEILGLQANALLVIANMIADNKTLGEFWLDRLRVARERIRECREVLAA